MSLKAKMMMVCLFITLIGLVTGLVGYVSVVLLSNVYNPIATRGMPLIQNLGDIERSLS